MNLETKSMCPFYRKLNGGASNPANTLQLEHIKQNAIRFTCSDHEYNTFLQQNGILAPNPSTILDQMRKQ